MLTKEIVILVAVACSSSDGHGEDGGTGLGELGDLEGVCGILSCGSALEGVERRASGILI